MQQQHRLPPGCVDLIPLHWDTGKSTQTEVVDGTKLAAVPEQQQEQELFTFSVNRHLFIFVQIYVEHVCIPDVKCGIEDIGLLQSIQLNLAVTHLVVNTFQFIIQLQLLPFKLTILLLVAFSTKRWERTQLLDSLSSIIFHCHLSTPLQGYSL